MLQQVYCPTDCHFPTIAKSTQSALDWLYIHDPNSLIWINLGMHQLVSLACGVSILWIYTMLSSVLLLNGSICAKAPKTFVRLLNLNNSISVFFGGFITLSSAISYVNGFGRFRDVQRNNVKFAMRMKLTWLNENKISRLIFIPTPWCLLVEKWQRETPGGDNWLVNRTIINENYSILQLLYSIASRWNRIR